MIFIDPKDIDVIDAVVGTVIAFVLIIVALLIWG
jgi:hypothetical protein